MSFLALHHINHCYPNQKQGLTDIHLELQKGEFHCLLGRSGCGKSTLLKIAAGLITPKTGHVLLNGKPLLKPSTEIGFVFQQPTLLDWLTVLENVLLPVALHTKPSLNQTNHAKALLDEVGLSELTQRYPSQLSGGQQSRVALARALLLQPPLLLLDEPFAALDALTREHLQDLLLRLCAQHHSTVLFVTHDVTEALYLGDTITLLEQGRLHSQHPVTIKKPRTEALRAEAEFAQLSHEFRLKMKQLQ